MVRVFNRRTPDTVLPKLPLPLAEYRGAANCFLLQATLDPKVGSEVCLVILEPSKGKELANLQPFELFCDATISKTDHGLVAFLLWTIREGQRLVAWYELFLDPHKMETIKLLSAWSQQTHLKAIVMDSACERVEACIKAKNVFDVDQLLMTLVKKVAHDTEGDFQLAKEQFLREHSIEKLLGKISGETV